MIEPPMPDESLQRLAKLEVISERQDRDFEAMRQDISDIKASVNAINLALAERKGGTKYLMVLLSTSALIGGVVTQVLNWFKVI